MYLNSAYLSLRAWGLLHQDWLDYGPDAASLEQAVDDVYQNFTDMGPEMQVNDFHSFIEKFIAYCDDPSGGVVDDTDSHSPNEPHERKFLFPNAMGVVGPLHCIDWIIRTSLSKLEFFPALLKQCKLVLQFMHSKKHRTFIEGLIRKKVIEDDLKRRCFHALKTGTDRFAQWRWKSVGRMTKDMNKVKEPLFTAMQGEDVKTWPIKTSSDCVKALRMTVSEPKTWHQLKCIDVITGPLLLLHGWFTGCWCHTVDQRKPHGKLKCPFQGLRAKHSAARVQQTIAEYHSLAEGINVEDFGNEVSLACLRNIFSFIGAMLRLKLLNWMQDIPFLIWQASVARDINSGNVELQIRTMDT